jgi:aconitase A
MKKLMPWWPRAVKPEQFRQVYIPMFDLGVTEKAASPLYDWRPHVVLISAVRRTGKGHWLHLVHTLTGMRPLAILPDNITTDHLSPSNAIMMDSGSR